MNTDSLARKRPTRRDALRILAVAGAAGAAWKLLPFGRSGPRSVSRTRVLMGTFVNLTVLAADREAAAAAADATLGRMGALESVLSRHRNDSELGRLNASGRLVGASAELLEVLGLAERVTGLGDGAFDVTIQPVVDLYRSEMERHRRLPGRGPIERALALVGHEAIRIEGRTVSFARPAMRVTLDGIAKGYIVDRGVDVLRSHGFTDVFVEAGGDLVASGDKGSETPWRVGIRNPRPGLALQARFDTRNRAVATSGDYMQPFAPDYSQHHILDPRTGASSPELASSTVLGPDAATADALATLTMVLGPRKGRDLLESLPACEGYFVSKNLEVTRTSGFSLV